MSFKSLSSHASRIAWLGVAGLVVFAAINFANPGSGVPTAHSAPPTQTKPPHAADEHAKYHADYDAVLKKAFGGPVDIYLDITQIEDGKPMLVGVHYVELIDVTGKELLRFKDAKDQQWLIDPDTVLAFRIRQK